MNKIRIHPTAEVSPEATIGDGTIIWHQAQIREHATIGKNCIIGKGVYIDFHVSVGDNCKIQNGAYIYHPAMIEDGVFLGPSVVITNDKIPRAVNPDMTLKTADDWIPSPVRISKGVAIGAGCVLLPGIRIGQWAMTGAGSVVTRDVPAYGLVVGNPAHLLGYVCPCGNRLEEAESGVFNCRACGRSINVKE